MGSKTIQMNRTSMKSEKPSRENQPSGKRRILRRLALLPILAVAGLYLLSMTSSRPDNLGVTNGKLAKCPDSPNCVSTQADDEAHRMDAIPMSGNNEAIVAKIKSVIQTDFPRARLVSEMNNYLHFEFTSAIFRFVDDVEFLVDDKGSVVNFRSASRVGHSDLGANRKRMEKIIERLKQ
jgi:uncharacterized protein (DUF1499 family)